MLRFLDGPGQTSRLHRLHRLYGHEEDRTPNSTKKLGIALSILFRYFFDTFEPWMLLILSASFGIFGLWPNYPIYPLPPADGFSCTRLRWAKPVPMRLQVNCKWTLRRSVLATHLCSWLSTSPCSSLCFWQGLYSGLKSLKGKQEVNLLDLCNLFRHYAIYKSHTLPGELTRKKQIVSFLCLKIVLLVLLETSGNIWKPLTNFFPDQSSDTVT